MSLSDTWREMLDLQAKLTLVQCKLYSQMYKKEDEPSKAETPEKLFGKIEEAQQQPEDNIPKQHWTPKHDAFFGKEKNTDPLCGEENDNMDAIMAQFGVNDDNE